MERDEALGLLRGDPWPARRWNQLRGAGEPIPDLRGAYLRDVEIPGIDFSGVSVAGADLDGANLNSANLSRADLRETRLSGADINFADLSRANLKGAVLSRASLFRAILSEADLRDAQLDEADIRHGVLIGTLLGQASLKSAQLIKADLRRAVLSGANLEFAKLNECDLSDADITGANLDNTDCSLVTFRGATLCGSTLVGANLNGARLVKADFRDADLRRANLGEAMFAGPRGENGPILAGARLRGTRFTPASSRNSSAGFLELATAQGLESADCPHLQDYLVAAFEYAHRRHIPEKQKYPDLVDEAVIRIQSLRQLFGSEDPPEQLTRVVQEISSELIRYLRTHPNEIHDLRPRQFEELIAEILASYGWEVQLTPPTKDGGYDIFAITGDASGKRTSWIIECKKYAAHNKVGVDIARALYGVKTDLRVANAMLATTSDFTRGVREFKASRWDFELQAYEGILEWINEYRPNPDGILHVRDNRLVLPGDA